MDIWKYFDITHRNHSFMNPSTSEKLDEIISLLELKPGAKVLDIGCGKAEPLLRIAERYTIKGVGVDASPFCIKDAREQAAKRLSEQSELTFVEMNGAKYPVEDSSIDLAICLGASWVFGGLRGTLSTLGRYVQPGGLVLAGEPFWMQEPDPEYLKMSGLTKEQFNTHLGNVNTAVEEGLIPLYAIVSTKEDFDRYEWMQFNAAERYAMENPSDPDVEELLKRVRHGREEYLRYGRDTLSWAMYLFAKPL